MCAIRQHASCKPRLLLFAALILSRFQHNLLVGDKARMMEGLNETHSPCTDHAPPSHSPTLQVIEGLTIGKQPWTLKYLRKQCAHAGLASIMTDSAHIEHSNTDRKAMVREKWGSITRHNRTSQPLLSFLDVYPAGHYLFDFNLQKNCPDLVSQFKVRCAFSDRILHLGMPLDPTHIRLKIYHASDQWHSSRVSAALIVAIMNYVEH
jgi:hypothetical protein